jgi:hypothetical protein
MCSHDLPTYPLVPLSFPISASAARSVPNEARAILYPLAGKPKIQTVKLRGAGYQLVHA